ncbi:hypothetical protein FHR76_002118 [Rhizobium sp. RAS22]|nr:hypothetical protein [Rhizobium sp. RAS22]
MNAPVSTTNIAIKTAVSDELIVNRDGSTSVQATSDLALQLASSWPLQISGNAGKLFTTYASLAATAYGEFTPWVFADPDINKNGLYRWNGASWVWSLPLPFSFLIASNFGAGTAAAIKATTLSPVSTAALILLPIADDYAGMAATVSFNGGQALAIKSSIGEDVTRLAAGSIVYGVISGNMFRLANDEAIASVILDARDSAEDASERANTDADRAHDEANRSETAAGVAAGYASDAVSQGNVPIYGTVLGVSALNIPVGINAFRLNGYADAGDLGGWFLATEVDNTGTLMPWQVQTNSGSRRWEFRADEASALSFGVKGDGSFDDRDRIYNALMWWRQTGFTLRFPKGSYRMASGILLDMSGVASAGKIIFEGEIKPDPGIGAAITFRHVRGGQFFCRVNGGGQTANYAVADPEGCDEAFRFEGGKGWKAVIWGKNYAGRVCRVTKSDDPNEFQGQLVDLSVFVDSSAERTETEAARLAAGVGQGFFIDTYATAFGKVGGHIGFWEKYGSIAENTTDIVVQFIETLYRGLTGFEARGVISGWFGEVNVGSELPAGRPDLFTVKASSTRASYNIHITKGFAVGGHIGFNFVQVGSATLEGLTAASLHTTNNDSHGLVVNACYGFDINHRSTGDSIGSRVIGGSSYGTLRPKYKRSVIEAMEVGSSVFECNFEDGYIVDGNVSNAADTPLIRAVGNTGRNYFNNLRLSSARINSAFLLTNGSKQRVRGGSAYNLNNGQLFNELPELFTDVAGWVDKANGSVVIPAGQTSIVVTHGMSAAPHRIFLQVYEPAGAIAKVNGAATATQFTITIPAAIGSDLRIDWQARMRYSA